MAVVIKNLILEDGFCLLEVEHKNEARMGQFYMLRAWGQEPILSRPISILDADEGSIKFLYRIIGKGTKILGSLEAGQEVTLEGPYGNGFPSGLKGRIALVGGGAGIAPLYLAAKSYKSSPMCKQVDVYLGFSNKEILTDEFRAIADKVQVNVGGYVTDYIDPLDYDVILTCGPEIMMRTLHKKCKTSGTPLYVSMEKHMACGLGLCKVCTCQTSSGRRTICKDGPIFLGSEVFDVE